MVWPGSRGSCWRGWAGCRRLRGTDGFCRCWARGGYRCGVALVGAGRVPELDDARRAAAVLGRELDPGEVLLFGSVAQGAACSDSDLDLVLVFDDLGDYADPQQLEVRARKAIRDATGFASDVRVTDRPEWEARAKRCRSTFETHIASHAVTLL